MFAPPGVIWQRQETFLFVTVGRVLLASRGETAMRLNSLQCTRSSFEQRIV